MCDVMPTISEDGSTDRDSTYSGDDANFEQLMVNMLDERDKLMETLRETQESLGMSNAKMQELERERDALMKQLQANTPQVSNVTPEFNLTIVHSDVHWQGKNITWNIPVQWTGALKNYLPCYKATCPNFSISRQYAEMCVVREIFNTERQKKVHARWTCTAKIYMPTVKINLPRAFGQCYVLIDLWFINLWSG